MKLCFILICLFTFGLSATTRAQQERVSLKLHEVSLKQVLEQIREQTKLQFMMSREQEERLGELSVNVKNETVERVLNDIFDKTSLTYIFMEDIIVVKERPRQQQKADRLVISGSVKDTQKQPIPGVTVMIHGTNLGTVTNTGGCFIFTIPKAEKVVLTFSFIGMKTLEIPYKGEKELNVVLEEETTKMDEVVVTGMNRRSKESFSGSYVTVDVEKLKAVSPNNILKGLQYFDPSFRIVESKEMGSDPNHPMEFEIRGDASIAGIDPSNIDILLDETVTRPNTPLFVLDGFIVSMNRILEYDLEQIKSVTILKDAAATAIYGSRATNGVIIVETQPIKEGKINISYGNNIQIQSPDLSDYNLLNASEKLELEMKAGLFKTTGELNRYNEYLQEVMGGVNTYWLSQPLRTAVSQRHSLVLSGGNELFRYSVGANVNSNIGVMKGSDKVTKGINFNIQFRSQKWNLQVASNVTDTKGNDTPYGSFADYAKINPYYRTSDSDGNYLKVLEIKSLGSGYSRKTVYNPLYNTQFNQKSQLKNLTLTNDFKLEYIPLDNLRLSLSASYTKGVVESDKFKPAQHTDFDQVADPTKKGSYNKESGNTSSLSGTFNISYTRQINKHMLSLMANCTYEESQSNRMSVSATGFPSDKMDDILFAYEVNKNIGGTESTSRSLGTTAQISYMYDNKYAWDFNVRGDISSRFGSNNQFAPFWSTGIRWNAHREKWLHKSISNLVLRASYGITGSQNFSPYQAMEFYTYSGMMRPYEGFEILGAELKSLYNPDLNWSKTNNLSFSLEAGLLQNRINASINYYNSVTQSLLIDYTLAPSTGFNSIMQNIGEIQNEGVDIFFSVIPVQNVSKRIQWTISANANHNKNTIKKISNTLKAFNEEKLKSSEAPLPIYQEGYSTSELFLVPSLGINPMNGREVFLTRNGEKTYEWNAADKVPMGETQPKLSGNINSNLTLGDFSLTLGFSFRLGEKVFNSTLMDKVENSNLAYNVDRRALTDRWTTPGQSAFFKGYSREGSATPASSRFLMTLNELRFNTINFSYRFSNQKYETLSRIGVSSVSLNAGTTDMLRFSSIREERGTSYPFARTYNISLSVLF